MAEKLVRMTKDDIEHEFVAESVPVWEEMGWTKVQRENQEEGVELLPGEKPTTAGEEKLKSDKTKEQRQLTADQAPQTSK